MEMNFHWYTCMSSQQQHYVIPNTKVKKKKKGKTTSIIEQFRCGFFVTIQNPVTAKCLIIMAHRCVLCVFATHSMQSIFKFFSHCFRVVCVFVLIHFCYLSDEFRIHTHTNHYMTRSYSAFPLSHTESEWMCVQCRTWYIFELKLSFVLAWSQWCILCVVRCTNNVLHVLVLWLTEANDTTVYCLC